MSIKYSQNFVYVIFVFYKQHKLINGSSSFLSEGKICLKEFTDNKPEVLSKETSICIRVIPANDKKSIQIKLQHCFFSLLKLKMESINVS